MNRMELRNRAFERLGDANTLILAQRWSGAYYLAGYAVECGLKACIARLTLAESFPPSVGFVRDCYTHSIETLLSQAGLKPQRDSDARNNSRLATNWGLVKDWNESARYANWTEKHARRLVNAINDPQDGVMRWIQVHW